ncbi:MAG: NADH-quinone oxidoreductase subunit M, partial [Flavisolibacter sp.]|nr:NADH-quinone oxidoreductase subunit M [Flavisolibacter sp.]
MIVFLLFLIPLIGGLVSFLIRDGKAVRIWTLFVSIVLLGVSLAANNFVADPAQLSFNAQWLGTLGSSFSMKLDGLSKLLCLLTAV